MAVEKISSECDGMTICCMHIDATITEFLKLAEKLGWTVPPAVPA